MRPGNGAFVIALALVLSACGSSGPAKGSKAAYEQGLKAAAQATQDAVAAAGLFGTTANYQAAAKAFRDTADRLSRLEPPANVAVDNRKLEAGLRLLADREQAIVAAAMRHDQQGLEGLLHGLARQPQIQQGLAAIQDLRRKGYQGVDGLLTFGSTGRS